MLILDFEEYSIFTHFG